MKRIDLVKLGFKRAPEMDFSDGGLKFTCYTLGRLRVSKTIYQGALYLSARVLDGKLTYEEYENLPGYHALVRLMGFPVELLTDEILEQYYQDCKTFCKHYEYKEQHLEIPERHVVIERLTEIKKIRQLEYAEVAELSRAQLDRIVALSDTKLRLTHSYIRNLKKHADVNIDKRADQLIKSGCSRVFMEDSTELKPSWYYTRLIQFFTSSDKKKKNKNISN